MAQNSRIERDQTPNGKVDALLKSETGAREPKGLAGVVIVAVALAWALFQLWYASPFSLISSSYARPIHLAFAIFLTFTTFPMLKSAASHRVPWYDWLLALMAAASALYLVVFYQELSLRPGIPNSTDLWFAGIGMVLLLEATRRALGPPLMVVATVFLIYTFFGPYFPEVISHRGASINRLLSHQWLTTEGVFGVAVGVSASFVFLFVLFGALLDKAGAGNYFIQVAFSLLGHMRGGPAKAAVVASGMTGIISGSSIANVVTTGTFTIPLMKRVGFPANKAAAIEVASSTNGQLTPPIMGAAAFLMVEYVGISYLEVIKHAILPALISYVALIYIVHLEAVKANMKGLPRPDPGPLQRRLFVWLTLIVGLCVLTLAVYYGMGWLKVVFGAATFWLVFVALVAAYVALLAYGCRYPELVLDDPDQALLSLPAVGPTVKSGLYYLLPVVVLIWCLAVERLSPGVAAFWATLFMVFIVVTQRPLIAWFKGRSQPFADIRQGLNDLYQGLLKGSRNMVGIGVATAAAGIVVGTVTLTGIGLVMTDFVELISGGQLLLILLFTAGISLVLGMGLPTTANYIVVSTLMAPVIVTLGAANGLVVPLIAAHLFVFYFGILADDTPPVGLAAFAAAAVAKSDPIRTGVQGFTYDIRTAILPFMFIFNTQLLLIDISSVWHLLMVVATATTAMLLFAAATQGYWLVRSRWWETVALLLIAFVLFRPEFFWDRWFPPSQSQSGDQIHQVVAAKGDYESLRMRVSGMNMFGNDISTTVLLPLGLANQSPEQRLQAKGLSLTLEEQVARVDFVDFGSVAQDLGIDFGWQIDSVESSLDRPAPAWIYLPTLLLLAGLAFGQLRRRRLAA